MTQHRQTTETRRARWLLPFTTEVDLPTIDSVLHLAEAGGATLVAVSFLVTPDGRRAQRVRPELLQQSQDFLEAVRSKAQRLALPVECHEVMTQDLLPGITRHLQQLECKSLVVASRGEHALFLHRQEMQKLVFHPPAQLLLLRFSNDTRPARHGLMSRLLAFGQRLGHPQARSSSDPTVPVPLRQDRSETSMSKKEA